MDILHQSVGIPRARSRTSTRQRDRALDAAAVRMHARGLRLIGMRRAGQVAQLHPQTMADRARHPVTLAHLHDAQQAADTDLLRAVSLREAREHYYM